MQRRLDGHRADDIGDHQEFQTQQDGATDVGPQAMIGVGEWLAAELPDGAGEARQQRAHDQHGHADQLEGAASLQGQGIDVH